MIVPLHKAACLTKIIACPVLLCVIWLSSTVSSFCKKERVMQFNHYPLLFVFLVCCSCHNGHRSGQQDKDKWGTCVKQGETTNGSWNVRNTRYRVPRTVDGADVGVKAFKNDGTLDNDISRIYQIFFANDGCFIMGTPLKKTRPFNISQITYGNFQKPPDDSRCLLWAKQGIEDSVLDVCMKKYALICSNVGISAYTYYEAQCKIIT
ncbi:uncharacterized protein LOC142590574 isoform X3 [Dermacentor variabilis]|uniref:uncharacterized protein LOC142590574 isoform X3 n=1 Tax=Dermacentor variabilis TaxID=34621 RepID=UPI003F5B5DE5